MEVRQSAKLAHVAYDVRGLVLTEAMRLEAAGHRILRLNIGNPAPFGFEAPDSILTEMVANLPAAHGYSDARGILAAREAVVGYHRHNGVTGLGVEDVWLGNGVSELIGMTLQALLDDGDEILLPSPDYPLWTAVATLAGGRAVHYRCDEESGWLPDLEDLESKVTSRTVALVLINPNNPTGAVYPRETLTGMVEIARRHQLVLFSDEIYDQILYDGVTHVPTAALAPDLLCVTFNGLSKAYRVAGFRAAWCVVSGPKEHAAGYLEGLTILANMRLCANVPGQYAVAAALREWPRSIEELVLPGGRLSAQRDRAVELLSGIEGVSCVKPAGAVYCFPRLDPAVHRVDDDEQFVLDLLRSEHVLVVHGRGFNYPGTDHFRVVTLPAVEDLDDAIGRIGRFLDRRRTTATLQG